MSYVKQYIIKNILRKKHVKIRSIDISTTSPTKKNFLLFLLVLAIFLFLD